MAKPKNRIMCPDCGRPKMLFESEREAERFIKWNSDDIKHGEKLRPYYCPACCGWHITHHKEWNGYAGRTDKLIDDYKRSAKNADSWLKKMQRQDKQKTTQQKVDEIMAHIDCSDLETKSAAKKFMREFMQEWWQEHEKFDGWMTVDSLVRNTVYNIVQHNDVMTLEQRYQANESLRQAYGIGVDKTQPIELKENKNSQV